MYAKRNIEDKKGHVAAPDPPAIVANQITEELDTNGSVSSTSLAISKPNPYAITVQSLLDSPSNKGLIILQSPKVSVLWVILTYLNIQPLTSHLAGWILS